eukprot:151151-Prymnesium_polylepis.1
MPRPTSHRSARRLSARPRDCTAARGPVCTLRSPAHAWRSRCSALYAAIADPHLAVTLLLCTLRSPTHAWRSRCYLIHCRNDRPGAAVHKNSCFDGVDDDGRDAALAQRRRVVAALVVRDVRNCVRCVMRMMLAEAGQR